MTIGNNIKSLRFRSYASVIRTDGTSTNQLLDTVIVRSGRQWNGGDDPFYRQKIQRKENATNAYDISKHGVLSAKMATDRTIGLPGNSSGYKEAIHRTLGNGQLLNDWDEAAIISLTNLCMSKAYKEVDRVKNAFGGLEFLAEFRQTLHMIKHPAESLAAYLNKRANDLLKKRQRSAARINSIKRNRRLSRKQIVRKVAYEERAINKTIAKSWLELQFGAKPFLGALSDAADAALSVFPLDGAVRTIRVTKKMFVTVPRPTTVTGFGFDTSYQTVTSEEYEYSVTLTIRLKYTGQFDGMSNLELLKARAGFNVSQLIPTLWELTPLSVFADYFVNVGDTLKALMTETKNVLSVDRMVTRRLVRRQQLDIRNPAWGTRDPLYYRRGHLVTYSYRYTRERWTMSIPPIVFTIPGLGSNQMLNLSAFVYTVLRK